MTAEQARVREALEQLAAAARRASASAHAPFSRMRVGAALRTVDGEVHHGCNVESASYGLTQCAERNALGTAITAGMAPGGADMLVIYLPGNTPLPPCGACRQVMLELLAPGAIVVACCDTEAIRSWSVDELLPDAFRGP